LPRFVWNPHQSITINLPRIIHGKRAITEKIALDFADALGTSPEFWMGLQTDIHLWEAKQKRKKISPFRLSRIRRNSKAKY
jgi:plasmid maintenance system antidote protein VapI